MISKKGHWLAVFISVATAIVFSHSEVVFAEASNQFWVLQSIGVAEVGTSPTGQPYQRRIAIGVIAPTPAETDNSVTAACIDNALKRKTGTTLFTDFEDSIDLAVNVWREGSKPTKFDESQSRNFLYVSNYANFDIWKRQLAFDKAVNIVQAGLREMDLSFRSNLIAQPSCLDRFQTFQLALIQRVCPSEQPKCGIKNGSVSRFLPGNQYADRFELLVSWARTVIGDKPTSLVNLNAPVFFGVIANADEVAKIGSSLIAGSSRTWDPYIAASTPEQSQIGLEKLVDSELKKNEKVKTKIVASTTFLVLNLPKQLAIPLAAAGVVERPELGLTFASDNPNAAFKTISDEVARRRVQECVNLRGVGVGDFAKVSTCSGYKVTSLQEMAACLSKADSCRPLLGDATISSLKMVGIVKNVVEMAQTNTLPRLPNLAFSSLAENASTKCGAFMNQAGGVSSKLSECLLTQAMGNAQQEILSKCLLGAATGTTKSMNSEQLLKAVECYGKDQKIPAPQITASAEALRCIEVGNNHDLQECIIRLQANQDQRAVLDCVADKADATKALTCYLTKKGGPAFEVVANCSKDPEKMKSCLEAALPDDVKKALDITNKCSSPTNTAGYLSCAQALGLNVDPKVTAAIECGAKQTSWVGAAACVAGQNIEGPLGQAAACYAGSAAAGGASAVGACIVSKALGFNEDLQILTQCATTTGGQPIATGACALGSLTTRELTFCQGKKFGEDKCFGENNTLRKTLNIGPGSTVATAVNITMDVVNGTVAFLQYPGATAEATLKNAGREFGIVKGNLQREVDKAVEPLRAELGKVVGPGLYVKTDGGNIQIGGTRIRIW